MSSDFEKDELQVEQYDAAEAEAKKKKILKRVGIGAGAAVLLGVLGYFGLLAFQEYYLTQFMVGGNGAWFNSKVVFIEDVNG
ncbi:MAG: hypothetical protein FWE41_01660 [Coriobacteriia bacterium]|nr:hypothetical protein [Coriobacteriia bacterium]MCL2749512.1 hypothetical protein [Coriobacteriia bacterium]